MKKVLWAFAVVLLGCTDSPPTIDVSPPTIDVLPPTFDGQSYKTVKIGEQEWLDKNLNTTVYANGDPISAILSDSEWSTTESGALAVYEGEILYNWYAVNDVRCLCPKGWHVPTDKEWATLTDFLGGDEVAGEKMKSIYGWGDERNGTNSSGFEGLPGGNREDNGNFSMAGFYGNWWSSSPSGSNAWVRSLRGQSPGVDRTNFFNLRWGFSVRCLKDTE